MQFPFFHNQKPRRYYHRPIYWDPEKEEISEAVAEAKKKNENGKNYQPSLKRGSFRRARFDNQDVDRSEHVRKERRASNIRFLLIIIVLFALAFLLYHTSSDYLNL